MKKGVIAVAVIVLVGAGVALPAGYFGQVAENTIRSRMANMPYGYAMEVVDYQRGWFSSTARLEWQPLGHLSLPFNAERDVPTAGDAADSSGLLMAYVSGPLNVDIEIAHGPVFFAVTPGVGLFSAHGRVFGPGAGSGEDAESPPGSGNHLDIFLSSFSGRTVHNRVEFNQLNWTLGPVMMHLADGRGEGEWSGPGKFQLERASLRNMELRSGFGPAVVRVSLSELEASAEYPQGLQSGAVLAASEGNLSMGEFRLVGADGKTLVEMTGLNSQNSVSQGDDGLYFDSGQAGMDSLEMMGRAFGPVEVTYRSGGYGEAAVAKLLDAMGPEIFAGPADAPPLVALPPPPAQPQPGLSPPAMGVLPLLSADMREALSAFLADGPYAEIAATLTYADEPAVKLDMRQAIEPDRVPAGMDRASLPAILASLDYTLDIEITRKAAEEVLGQFMLQMGAAQGLLTQGETGYGLSMAFRNGQLEMNGRAIPLPLPPQSGPPPPFEGAPQSPFENTPPSPFEQETLPSPD
ncbi:DUF945 family protein [Candidatus Foliamicus sp.]